MLESKQNPKSTLTFPSTAQLQRPTKTWTVDSHGSRVVRWTGRAIGSLFFLVAMLAWAADKPSFGARLLRGATKTLTDTLTNAPVVPSSDRSTATNEDLALAVARDVVGPQIRVTPKPYVELAEPEFAPLLAKAPTQGVVPGGATPLEVNKFNVGVGNFGRHYVTQITPEVCWAACSQMVLSANGFEASQTNIIQVFRDHPGLQGVFSSRTDDFAGLQDICKALENVGRSPDGKERILATPFELSMHGSVLDLAQGRPVIACLMQSGDIGHACVLHGLTVSFIQPGLGTGFFDPNRLVRRPWTYDLNQPELRSKDTIDLAALAGVFPDMNRYRAFYFSILDPFVAQAIVIHEARLADPYGESPPEMVLTGEEFKKRIRYLIRVRVVP